MQFPIRTVLAIAAAVLLICAPTPAAWSVENQPAQSPPKPGQKPVAPAVQAVAPEAPPAPPTPIRTETMTFDAWTVTCREYADPKIKKSCFAQIQITQSTNGQVVLLWTFGLRDDHQLESLLRLPTGVNIAQGVSLKLGTASARKLTYSTCEPAYCTSSAIVDVSLQKELVTAETIEFTIFGSAGNNIRLSFQAKGADKALAALLR